ncbi:MAG: gas vesicle protein [Chlorobi bacterium OLB4]|nr:MAG: gas vesicle protein [Chlorobi bacterium OLB4]
MDDNKMAKGMMIGFITGGIVGSIIALLYAPKSGRELRADIKVKKR